MITDQGLNPDQAYILFNIKEGNTPTNIDVIIPMIELGFCSSISEGIPVLTPKAIDFIKKLESYFKSQTKKTSAQLLGPEFKENITKYQETFPKIKLPSGKAARSAVSNVETNFKWFFEKHQFGWPTILKATAMYVDEYEKKTPSFLYMRTSAYFIRKTELDKSTVSDLANYCEIVESGDGLSQARAHFSEKVV